MSITTAIILAAGLGSRLQALGKEQPKGFLCLGEQPIIVESLLRLQAVGVQRVLLVVGYQAGYYQRLAAEFGGVVQTLHNPLFDQSGSLYSLLLAAAEVSEDFLLLESDIVYEPRALQVILDFPAPHATLLSGQTNSGDEVYVETNKGLLCNMSKQRHALGPRIAGEFVGISKGSPPLLQALRTYAEQQGKPAQQMHYETDGLVGIAGQVPIHCPKVNDLIWTEIDDEDHLRRAQQHIYPRLSQKLACKSRG
jgi:2-aminoethylphosphonate-pyruvate transaminase